MKLKILKKLRPCYCCHNNTTKNRTTHSSQQHAELLVQLSFSLFLWTKLCFTFHRAVFVSMIISFLFSSFCDQNNSCRNILIIAGIDFAQVQEKTFTISSYMHEWNLNIPARTQIRGRTNQMIALISHEVHGRKTCANLNCKLYIAETFASWSFLVVHQPPCSRN